MCRQRLTMVTAALVLAVGLPARMGLGAQGPASPGLTVAAAAALPASDDAAKAILKESPFHAEWINVYVGPGKSPLRTYIVHPVRKTLGPVIIVVPDNRGMTDWARAVGHQLAKAGYTAMVADMLSGLGPNEGNSESIASMEDRSRALTQLSHDEIMRRLQAEWDFGFRLPAVNGKLATMGFGWGAGPSVDFATAQPALAAVVVFDGPASAAVKTPVIALKAGDEQAWSKALAFLMQHAN